jgi:hypothetical protein
MMLDWSECRKQLAGGVKEFGQLSLGTVKGYVELSSAGQKTDLLGTKIRELIAPAVAVTARCDGWHYGAYRSRNAPRCDKGRNSRSIRRRDRGHRWGGAGLFDARAGRGQGICACRSVEGMKWPRRTRGVSRNWWDHAAILTVTSGRPVGSNR